MLMSDEAWHGVFGVVPGFVRGIGNWAYRWSAGDTWKAIARMVFYRTCSHFGLGFMAMRYPPAHVPLAFWVIRHTIEYSKSMTESIRSNTCVKLVGPFDNVNQ